MWGTSLGAICCDIIVREYKATRIQTDPTDYILQCYYWMFQSIIGSHIIGVNCGIKVS